MKLRCTESWREEMARQRKIPFIRLSGALHCTDAHIAEIIRVFEVLPAGKPPVPVATPARPANAAALLPRPPGYVELRARPPRKPTTN